MFPATSMMLESLKIPKSVLTIFRDKAKAMGVSRSFLEREYLIEGASQIAQGKPLPKRTRMILDVDNLGHTEQEPEQEEPVQDQYS